MSTETVADRATLPVRADSRWWVIAFAGSLVLLFAGASGRAASPRRLNSTESESF
jgi:hypothetical protein